MSYTQLIQGTRGRCGTANRVLLPPGSDGRCCCNLCPLLIKLQHMSARLDSESNHRYVCLYRVLQEAAQRFWITPPEMNHYSATNTARELSIHPTPIVPTTTTTVSPRQTTIADPTLPPSFLHHRRMQIQGIQTWAAHTGAQHLLRIEQSPLPLTTFSFLELRSRHATCRRSASQPTGK